MTLTFDLWLLTNSYWVCLDWACFWVMDRFIFEFVWMFVPNLRDVGMWRSLNHKPVDNISDRPTFRSELIHTLTLFFPKRAMSWLTGNPLIRQFLHFSGELPKYSSESPTHLCLNSFTFWWWIKENPSTHVLTRTLPTFYKVIRRNPWNKHTVDRDWISKTYGVIEEKCKKWRDIGRHLTEFDQVSAFYKGYKWQLYKRKILSGPRSLICRRECN